VIFRHDIIEEAEATVRHSREVMPSDLCKQEVSTLGVRSRRSCIFEGLAYEGLEEVWGERKVSASLNRTIPHPLEVWDSGLQA
jgi:hypothetical protein